MKSPPCLDAHCHLDPVRSQRDLARAGAVLAMTFSLEGARPAVERRDPLVAWGVGCHPRIVAAQENFDIERFRDLARQTAVVGEVGLDTGSRVPLKVQLEIFRQVLGVIADLPRPVSIHSYRAAGLVLRELRRQPVRAPILHWWTGTVAETRAAVELGCYFSIHSQVARHSKFRTGVPIERVLVESDHGINDPPAAIPCRVGWVEHLVAQQYGVTVGNLRYQVWQNFARIVRLTNAGRLVPRGLSALVGHNRGTGERRK